MQNILHEADIFGNRVRYFSSPLYVETNEADLPWTVFTDIVKMLGLNDEASQFVLRELRSDWIEPKTIATSEGIVTIAPNFMASGLIDAIGQRRKKRPENFKQIRGLFRRNLTEAVKKMTEGFSPVDRMSFVLCSMDKSYSDYIEKPE